MRNSVLLFDNAGRARGLVADPSLPSSDVVAELDALGITFTPDPSEPTSAHCSQRIPRRLPCGTRVAFLCTEPIEHRTQHEARGLGEGILARMALRKPSPRPRKRVAR